MIYLKKYKLFENKSFPTSREKIVALCQEYRITEYTIDHNGVVDVHDSVNLDNCNLERLPLRFGKVNGYFSCEHNRLTTLEGAPRIVSGGFYCMHNYLTDLIGSPELIDHDFNCSDNNLETLEGCIKKIGGKFFCNNNQLTTLIGGPIEANGYSCCMNNLTSLEGAPKIVRGSFDCDSNQITSLIGSPRIILGYFSFDSNKVSSFEGCPEQIWGAIWSRGNLIRTLDGVSIKGIKDPRVVDSPLPEGLPYYIHLEDNPIYEIAQVFGNLFFVSLKFNYLVSETKIRESRFLEACDELGVTAPEEIKGYDWV